MKAFIGALSCALRLGAAAMVLAMGCMFVHSLQAQEAPVQVLSGEHEDFTRIAMVLSRPVPWSFERVADGYVLRLDGAAPEFDISDVFARIPRTRLQALEAGDNGTLGLVVSAETQARAYEDRPGLLIIDMHTDPVAPRLSPRRRARSATPPRTDWLDWGVAAVAPPPSAETSGTARDGGTPAPLPDPDLSSEPAPRSGRDLDVEAVRATLLGELERAADQGLVTPVSPSHDASPAMPSAETPPPAAASGPPELTGADDHAVLRSETAVDRAARLRRGTTGVDEGDDCRVANRLDVASWGGDSAAAEQLAQARHAVYGPAAPSGPDARALVQTYLHFGFGAEARMTLDAFEDDITGGLDPDGVLRTMSFIVDGNPVPPASQLARMIHCDGPIVLWALLAGADVPDLQSVAVADATRAFSDLPRALRRSLAPRLVQRFLELDDVSAARAVHDALSRITDAKDPALLMVAAQIDKAAGDAAAARARLRPLAASNAPGSDDAVVMLIGARLAQDRAPARDLVASAGARATARAGTPIGARLARAEALGLAALGDFDAAFAAQARATDSVEAEAARIPLGAALIGRLADAAPDPDFLRLIFAREDWQSGALPPAIRPKLAERFLKLGFASAALSALGDVPNPAQAEQLLRADARIMRDDPAAALQVLDGLSHPRAAHLRSRALTRSGDHSGALEAHGTDTPEDIGALAWRAGEWGPVRNHGTQAQRAMVAFAAPALNDLPDGSGPLAMGSALLEASGDLRARAAALIDEIALP